VTREGLPGDLYDAKLDQADGAAFLERSDGDRHQFRFIVSPIRASGSRGSIGGG
jgi:type IV secretory pathway VirD2 relaxase